MGLIYLGRGQVATFSAFGRLTAKAGKPWLQNVAAKASSCPAVRRPSSATVYSGNGVSYHSISAKLTHMHFYVDFPTCRQIPQAGRTTTTKKKKEATQKSVQDITSFPFSENILFFRNERKDCHFLALQRTQWFSVRTFVTEVRAATIGKALQKLRRPV